MRVIVKYKPKNSKKFSETHEIDWKEPTANVRDDLHLVEFKDGAIVQIEVSRQLTERILAQRKAMQPKTPQSP